MGVLYKHNQTLPHQRIKEHLNTCASSFHKDLIKCQNNNIYDSNLYLWWWCASSRKLGGVGVSPSLTLLSDPLWPGVVVPISVI